MLPCLPARSKSVEARTQLTAPAKSGYSDGSAKQVADTMCLSDRVDASAHCSHPSFGRA